MRHRYYTIRTREGITFHLEASNEQEAWRRAKSPIIGNTLANMMREAVSNISSVELQHGPQHLMKYPVFDEEIFKN